MDVGGTSDLAAVLVAGYNLDLAEAPLLLADSGGVRVWQVTAADGQWVARLYLPGGPSAARVRADVALYAGLRGHGLAAPEVLPGQDGAAIQWMGEPGALPALVITRAERLRPLVTLPGKEGGALRACDELGRAVAALHAAGSQPELAPLFPRQPSRDPLQALLTPAGLHGGLAAGQRLWLPDDRLYLHDLASRAWGPAACDLADLALWCGRGPRGDPGGVPWGRWLDRLAAVLAGYTAIRALTPLDRDALLPLTLRRARSAHDALADRILLRSDPPAMPPEESFLPAKSG